MGIEANSGQAAAQQIEMGLNFSGMNSKGKNQHLSSLKSKLTKTPQLWLQAKDLLRNGLADLPEADKLLRRLDDQSEFMANMRKKDFLKGVITMLNGDRAEQAQKLILGLLESPSDKLKQSLGPVGVTAGINEAINIGLVLSEAMMDLDDEGGYEKQLAFISSHIAGEIVSKDPERIFFHDYLLNAAYFGNNPEAKYAAELVHSVLTLFDAKSENRLNSLSLFFNKEALGLRTQLLYEIQKGTRFNSLVETYEPASLQDQYRQIEEVINSFRFGKNAYFDLINQKEFNSQKEPHLLANRYLEKLLKYYEEKLKKDQRFEAVTLALPGGVSLLAGWEKEKKSPGVVKANITKAIKVYLEEAYPGEAVGMVLKPVELDTLITYLAPEYDQPALVAKNAALLNRVKTGMELLNEGGNVVKLKRKDEQWLRDMGLNSILFKEQDGKTQVTLNWSGWQAEFSLDENYQLIGLGGLSDSNKDWLSALTYSYLGRIVNSGSQAGFSPEEGAAVSGGEPASKKNGVTRPHIRVEHVNRSANLTSPERESILAEANRRLGLDLILGNQIFHSVIKGDVFTTINQPYLKLIEKAMARIEGRPEQPVWATDEQGKTGMILTKPGADDNPDNSLYWINFVRESVPDRLKGKPIEVDCPGAGNELQDLRVLA